MRIYDLLQNLITKKFYTEEAIKNKLNVFYAMNVLSDEEYSDLMLKVQEVYEVIEEVQEETENSAEEEQKMAENTAEENIEATEVAE